MLKNTYIDPSRFHSCHLTSNRGTIAFAPDRRSAGTIGVLTCPQDQFAAPEAHAYSCSQKIDCFAIKALQITPKFEVSTYQHHHVPV
jgi:hypothetical protein